MKETRDGLLVFPYTHHDWLIVLIAISGYLFRMYLMYKDEDSKNPKIEDWLGIFILTLICTVSLYEVAIIKNWTIRLFLVPFAICVIVSKEITDWLFLSKEGKNFIISSFKNMLSIIFEKMGYIKKEKNE